MATVSPASVGYVYDGDNRRVAKTNGKLYWFGMAESDLSGNITSEYIFFGGTRIARRDVASGNVYYYLADRLGSARVVTNATGGVVEESDFLPFGTERAITDSLDNNYKFTGHERDTESGLDHTLYRKYSSTLARWHSPDPVRGKPRNPQSWNRFSYTTGNPVNRTDPSGAEECDGLVANGVCFEYDDEFHDDDNEVPCYDSGGLSIGKIGRFTCAQTILYNQALGNIPAGFPHDGTSFWDWLAYIFDNVVPGIPSGGTSALSSSCTDVNTQLRSNGPGFYTYGERSEQYGQAGVIDLLQMIASDWNSSHPDLQIGFGRISRQGGGPIPGELSHRTGLDVDVRPFRNDGAHTGVTIDSPDYDRDDTDLLIQLFRSYDATFVFFDDTSIAGVRPWPGHRDHFHVRFRSGANCR